MNTKKITKSILVGLGVLVVLIIIIGATVDDVEKVEDILDTQDISEVIVEPITKNLIEEESETLTEIIPTIYEKDIKKDTQLEQETQASPSTQETKDEPMVQESKIESSIGGKWYTSSYHTTKYYYHESCQGWQSLSEKYFKSFNSESELLKVYSRALHPDCKPK